MNMLNVNFRLRTALILSFCLLLAGCSNVNFPTLQDMLINLSSNFPALYQLITAVSYLMGLAFLLRGVYQLKIYGDMRTMMSSQSNIKGALVTLIVGSCLLFLPSAFQSVLLTTFGTQTITPINWSTSTKNITPEAMHAILGLVQLVGLIAFIRGFVYLTQSGNPGSQHSLGKAMTHIIGGLFAVNIQGTVNLLQNTFGVTSS